MKGFIEFIREQGVVGFATGFILGGAISNLVGAFVKDFVNPLVGIFVDHLGNIETATFHIWSATFAWGDFLSVLINFVILAFVVYFLFKILKLEKLDVCDKEKK